VFKRTTLQTIILLVGVLLLCGAGTRAQQQSSGTLRGTVTDQLGGLLVGATVTATDASGVERTATSDDAGNYVFTALPPGRYTVHAAAPGFVPFETTAVEVAAGRSDPLNITLSVSVEQETVTVTEEAGVSTEPESNVGAVVLRGADLDTLPDDPDDLAEALQALAGPSAGPEGGELYIDGFTGGRLPPKESIREIRVNQNPFSAEFDRLGYGRIEIFTKPGTDKLRGQASFNFNDEKLNSRNPFAPTRAPFQSRRFGGNLSGPIVAKKASFFLDFERRETDDNEVVNAVVLDPALNVVPFTQTVLSPRRNTTFSPRLDYQLNPTNTLVARYTYEHDRRANTGVGDLSLPERAVNNTNTQHTFNLTETAVINQKVINETRFQFIHERSDTLGGSNAPTLRVNEAFTGGGAQSAGSANELNRFELSNYTSWTAGRHSLKAGGRLRGTRITNLSPQNFAGTLTFAGGAAPQLDANNQIVLDANGQPVLISISSIERLRRTRLLQGGVNPATGLPFTPAEIRARGGGPTQFSLAGGNPQARVTQYDFGPFIQDDWRVRPNLTISAGLRYETQTNISSHFNFAPRVAFAWSPAAAAGKGNGRPTVVVRGGFGLFYTRFSENLTLQANRFNGTNQQQFVVTTTTTNGTQLLDQVLFTANNGITNVPTLAQLAAFSIPQTVRRVAPDLSAPYTMQASLSVEKQLPGRTSLSVNFINARTLHLLRSRNINAPLPGTITPATPAGVRPFAGGNIFEFESSGRFNQTQLIVSANNRASRKFTVFASYTLNRARSDTDGAGSFPVNQFDLSNEYGRSAQDIRHRLFIGGSINALPWDIRLSPFITANSGRPFNITTGRDTNGDTLFTERPAFATDLSKPGIITTRFGTFDPNPAAGQALIPRNFATGPAFFTVNLRVSKSFGFGELRGGPAGAGQSGGGGGRGGGGRGGRGGGGLGGGGGAQGGGSFGDAQRTEKRYGLNISVNFQNLLNHTNLGQPIGNLSSPLFGRSTSTAGGFGGGAGGGGGNPAAGNRRVELSMRFSF
jgi:hypothetical protein